ncbi:tetratricopeptide repeat protein [bacterium]|nr:tetratricopeptide repeat protein [bacterium]
MRYRFFISITIVLFGFSGVFSLGSMALAPVDKLAFVKRLTEEGAYSRARPGIEKLLFEYPEDLSVHLGAARLYKKMGLWSRAIMEYEWVRTHDPVSSEPYIALSEMYLENLSSDLALSMAEEAIRLAPQSKKAHAQLISALLASYRYQDADRELRGLLGKFPRDAAVRHLAYQLNKNTGDLKAAKHYLEEAIELDPRKPAWLLELSDICEALGDIGCARASLKEYLKKMPDSVEALQKQAWLQERYMFDYPAATRTYELILARDPENWVAEAGLERLNLKATDPAENIKRGIRKFFSDIGTWLESFRR